MSSGWKRSVSWGLVVATCLVLGLGVEVGAAAKQVLKLGTILPVDNILTENAQEFAKKVNERSKGEVEVIVYPNSQLGNERDLMEGLQLGTVQMAEVSGGVMSTFAPEAGVFSLPFVFNGWDHLDKVLKAPVADRLGDMVLKKTGIRVLGWMEQGFRVTLTVRRVINGVQDFEGLKIREPEDKVLVRTFQLVKARPTVIAWGEVYTSLQTGVVDCFDNSKSSYLSLKFYEVAKHYSLTEHFIIPNLFIMGLKFYNSLPKDIQNAIVRTGQDYPIELVKMLDGYNSRAFDVLKSNGVTVLTVEKKPFMDAVAPIYDQYLSTAPADARDLFDVIKRVK